MAGEPRRRHGRHHTTTRQVFGVEVAVEEEEILVVGWDIKLKLKVGHRFDHPSREG